MGARKIIVSNVGPIGCIPFERDTNPSAGRNCVEFPNQMAQSYNKRLKDLVLELSSNLEGALIVYANVYNIVADIIQNHENYGIISQSNCCSSVSKLFVYIGLNLVLSLQALMWLILHAAYLQGDLEVWYHVVQLLKFALTDQNMYFGILTTLAMLQILS